MTEEVGIVYGTTSPTSFKFAVSDTSIRKNDYIQISHKDIGNVLGQITGIERETNISFEKAKRIGTGEKLSTEDKVSAIVSIIGYKDERGVLSVPRTPFEAGGKVLRAEESLLRSVLGLKDEKGAYIGFLKGHKIKVYLDINSIVQKHISILSKTGGGKSYVVGVLLEELLKKSVPVVIIDPHGEYSSLMHPNINESEYKLMEKFDVKARSYAEQIVEYSPDTKTNLHALPLRLDATNLEARDIIELSNLRQTGPCGGIISRAIRKLRERSLEYTFEDIVAEVSEDKNASRIGIIAPLEYLSSLGVFSYPPTKLSEIVKEGQATIINLKGVAPEAQEIVVARIVSRLFEARKLDKIKAHLLVIE
ncbi:MAG: ATP-binding protein, partial [Candidatus Thermoplasmatota archaeon]